MPTFERCDKAVEAMAKAILSKFSTHQPLIDAGVTIDFVFAYSDKDEKTGEPVNFGLSKDGHRALGRADAEIALDGDWWKEDASEQEQEAVLDHELHHIEVKTDNRGVVTDDLGRPCLMLRKHDFEVGLFHIIAQRHGAASQECKIIKHIHDRAQQIYFAFLIGQQQDYVEQAVAKSRAS